MLYGFVRHHYEEITIQGFYHNTGNEIWYLYMGMKHLQGAAPLVAAVVGGDEDGI